MQSFIYVFENMKHLAFAKKTSTVAVKLWARLIYAAGLAEILKPGRGIDYMWWWMGVVERGDGSYSPGVFVHYVNLTLSEFLPNVLGDLGNHPPLVRLHRLVPKEKHVWMLPLFPPRAQHLEKAAQHCQAGLVNLPGVPLYLYTMEFANIIIQKKEYHFCISNKVCQWLV